MTYNKTQEQIREEIRELWLKSDKVFDDLARYVLEQIQLATNK